MWAANALIRLCGYTASFKFLLYWVHMSFPSFEPAHEIMALFVLCYLILQSRMRSHPVGQDVWFLVGPCVYSHTLCVRKTMALARLRGCAGLPEPSLVAHAISTIISWAGSFVKYLLNKGKLVKLVLAAGQIVFYSHTSFWLTHPFWI